MYWSNIFGFFISFGLLMFAVSVHEFAHGWVAYKLGDNTARYSGRLTLNPLAHIDPFWTLLLPLILFLSSGFVFGAAKPVPINYSFLRNPKRDIIWVGLSGPLANFLFAFVLALIWRSIPYPPPVTAFIFRNLIQINVILGVFNLVPIPPLDGSRVIMGLLPDKISYRYAIIEPYGFIILLGLLWLGAFDNIIWPLARYILFILLGS